MGFSSLYASIVVVYNATPIFIRATPSANSHIVPSAAKACGGTFAQHAYLQQPTDKLTNRHEAFIAFPDLGSVHDVSNRVMWEVPNLAVGQGSRLRLPRTRLKRSSAQIGRQSYMLEGVLHTWCMPTSHDVVGRLGHCSKRSLTHGALFAAMHVSQIFATTPPSSTCGRSCMPPPLRTSGTMAMPSPWTGRADHIRILRCISPWPDSTSHSPQSGG
jgi:hypothetical protein